MDDVLKTTAKTCKHGSFLVFLPGGRSLVGFWGLRYPSPVKTNMDFLVKRTWRRDESSKFKRSIFSIQGHLLDSFGQPNQPGQKPLMSQVLWRWRI